MSHEGIRIVDRRALLEPRRAERPLTRDEVEPVNVKVDKTGGSGMTIQWKDGHASQWNFAWLRHACPCATCVDEREQYGLNPGQSRPEQAAPGALPMFKAPRDRAMYNLWVITRCDFRGTMATRAGYIRGIICGASALARRASRQAEELRTRFETTPHRHRNPAGRCRNRARADLGGYGAAARQAVD